MTVDPVPPVSHIAHWMRPGREFLRLLTAVALLLAVGVVPLVGDAHVPSEPDPCSDGCPGGSDCDGSSARCGCCARVAPAVVPVAVAASGPLRAPAPAAGDPAVAEPAVVLRLPDRFLEDPARLATVLVTTPDGLRVHLGTLARIRTVEAPPTIAREWGKRRAVVQANARGRDVGSFVADVRRAVSGIELPAGYAVTYGGQFEHLERARRRRLAAPPAG